jgi:cytoskeleton protein RodZ
VRDKSILGVRTWRVERGITLESIAEATKISVRQLDAIEKGDFKRLPGGIYDTNYIKQYARAIEFSEGALLAAYHACCRGDAPALVMSYS